MRTKKLLLAVLALVLIATGAFTQVPTPAIAAPAAAAAASTLPAGFSVESTPTALGGDGSYKLTDMKYVSPSSGVEGGMLLAGKAGEIAWLDDAGNSRILGQVPNVRDYADNGMVGITPAIDYKTTRRIYVLYTLTGTSHNYGMLGAYLVNSVAHPTAATFEKNVIDGVASNWIDDGANHQVGDVMAWPDGSLYISQGDGTPPTSASAQALWAQDINDPHGKILHVGADGKGTTSNPYYDAANATSWKSRVYAVGVRNGFRLWRDPVSGHLLSSIVGWNNTEMVAYVKPAGNYGWPCYEGPNRAPGYSAMSQCVALYKTLPPPSFIYTYAHDDVGASVTGGVTYTGTTYPAVYKNKTFIGDFARSQIITLGTDGSTLTSPASIFGSGDDIGSPTSVVACANGDICWSDIINSRVIHLHYGLANQPPVAQFHSTVSAGRSVAFDASATYDPEGDALTYKWNFGDGKTGTGITPTHVYAANGPFTVKLTVTDATGNVSTMSSPVSPANQSPKITLTTPTQTDFAVGDAITLKASVKDKEDGTLPAAGISWTSELRHCPFNGECHVHPSTSGTGAKFTVPFPDHGGDTSVVITVTSPPDSQGVTSSMTYTALPRLRSVTITTPSDVTATINSDVTNSSQAVAKSALSLSVPTTSASAGAFVKWSDGVTTASRQLTMPDAALTLTAVYKKQSVIDQRYQALGGAGGLLGAPTGAEFAVAGGRERDYEEGSLYYSADTGVHYVKGAIRFEYQDLGGPAAYGFPTNDETAITGGAYNTFSDYRSIYWSDANGAHEVHGGIYKKYTSLGGSAGRLGFPTSDEEQITAGTRNYFVGGYISWSNTKGVATVTYY